MSQPHTSVGLLLWRVTDGHDHLDHVEVLLGHMGGPYWARRDAGAWTIPKGLAEPGDTSVVATAEREFREELGLAAPSAIGEGPDLDLGEHRVRAKTIRVLARRGDLDPTRIDSNVFELEWPPRSGQRQQFPEVDRAAWMDLVAARTALAGNQQVFVDRLAAAVSQPG